jgi:hypothetical protein
MDAGGLIVFAPFERREGHRRGQAHRTKLIQS